MVVWCTARDNASKGRHEIAGFVYAFLMSEMMDRTWFRGALGLCVFVFYYGSAEFTRTKSVFVLGMAKCDDDE